MLSIEEVAQELSQTTSIDDFTGEDGTFAKLFSKTIEEMLAAEPTSQLGCEPDQAEEKNSGNSRNGLYTLKKRISDGDAEIKVPRDWDSEFQSALLKKINDEIQQKVIAMYAKGVSKRDIQDILEEIYVIDISPDTIIIITEKVWQMVESWKNGPLALINAMVHLDALHIKLKRDAETASIAVSGSPGVDLNGNREILGHWISGLQCKVLTFGSFLSPIFKIVLFRIFSWLSLMDDQFSKLPFTLFSLTLGSSGAPYSRYTIV